MKITGIICCLALLCTACSEEKTELPWGSDNYIVSFSLSTGADTYTAVIRETDSGLSVMVDGSAIAMESGAVRLDNGEVYISDMFLRTALRATTIYDSDEQSLILFVRNKSVSTSTD